MSKKEKLLQKLLTIPKDFTWEELVRVLNNLGYQLMKKGKTSGSRRRFTHDTCGFIILHEPHPKNILKKYQLEQVIERLKQENFL